MTQDQAFEVLKSGSNVFLTGGAGSGKTFLLSQFIDWLKDNKKKVAITASTGIAATHLGGVTIHSWSGIGLSQELSQKEIKKIAKKPKVKKNIKDCEVLIIDEISMLDGRRLDLVDDICKAVRDPFLPFGGLQVVFCGDFFQLPPISARGEEANFAFQASSWSNARVEVCYLSSQYRQNDKAFVDLLDKIRAGLAGPAEVELLQGRINQKVESFQKPTRLYTHNIDVDRINDQELASLSGVERKYQMSGSGPTNLVTALKKNCLAPEELRLKKGALVMFVKNNFKDGYVNGTLGQVDGFTDEDEPIILTRSGEEIVASPERWVYEEDGVDVASIEQIPLRLAWAITVHKSQGMSLDAAEIDLSKSFEKGMGYVALSRVRTLLGLSLTGFNTMSLQISEEVLARDVDFRTASREVLAKINQSN